MKIGFLVWQEGKKPHAGKYKIVYEWGRIKKIP